MRIPLLHVTLTILLTSCTGAGLTEARNPAILVRITADSVHVTNRLAEPIYVSLADYDDLPAMNLWVCQSRIECGPGLPAGSTLGLGVGQIAGGHDGVRRVAVGARVFRSAQSGADSAVSVGYLLLTVPR